MKPSYSELNLSSVTTDNGMKLSNSAFEILSISNNNLTEIDSDPVEEPVKVKSAKKVNRPKTFK